MLHLRRAFTVLVAMAAIACGDDSTSPRTLPFEGTYKLTHVNGSALPYTTTIEGVSVTVTSGTLELSADSTYVMMASARAMLLGQVTDLPVYDEGTYVRSGNDVSFPFMLNDTEYAVTGTVSGGVMTLTIADPLSPIQSMVLRREG